MRFKDIEYGFGKLKKIVEKKWNKIEWFVGLESWMIWNSMEWNKISGMVCRNMR